MTVDPFARRKQQTSTIGRPPPRSDVDRILALPRTTPPEKVDLSRVLRPGAVDVDLLPVQHQALGTLAKHGKLFGAIGTGHGKSIISLLAGAVLDADLSIVLVAPITVKKTHRLLEELSKHYKLPQTVIISWSTLSGQEGRSILADMSVDALRVVLVADEAHRGRNLDAACTSRLMRWLWAHPKVKFVPLSGTMTTRTLRDFAHLAHRSLGSLSPVPTGPDLRCWDEVFANEFRSPADVRAVWPLWQWATVTAGLPLPRAGGECILPEDTLKQLHRAFGERLATCPGVVVTDEPSCSASLYIVLWTTAPSKVWGLWAMAKQIAATYRDPDGLELPDAAAVAKTAKRLSLGYYLRWEWDGPVDRKWLDARQTWFRTCRGIIERHRDSGLDTQGLVEAAAAAHFTQGDRSQWVLDYEAWRCIQHRAHPRSVATWVSDVPMQAIVARAKSEGPSIIWYDEDAVAEKLRELGVPVVPAGVEPPSEAVTVALSYSSHGIGLDLQAWSVQVFACVPANGTAWEQVLGRTHRHGQGADEIVAWVPQWTSSLRSALAKARRDAAWVEGSMTNRHKLGVATYIER